MHFVQTNNDAMHYEDAWLIGTVIYLYVNVARENSYFILNRHGIRQLRTGWADGPAYITQCPIQPSQSYVYNFTITGQRGTLLWHAHILWLRATVHGALVVLPKLGVPYPFPKPHSEVVVILGELKTANDSNPASSCWSKIICNSNLK